MHAHKTKKTTTATQKIKKSTLKYEFPDRKFQRSILFMKSNFFSYSPNWHGCPYTEEKNYTHFSQKKSSQNEKKNQKK